MKRIIWLLTVISLLNGCSTVTKTKAVQSAVDQGIFKNIDRDSTFSITVPSAHSGAYKSVDQLNFIINDKNDKAQNASAILGKSRKTGEWEVLRILVNHDGQWSTLPLNN